MTVLFLAGIWFLAMGYDTKAELAEWDVKEKINQKGYDEKKNKYED